MNAAGSGLPVDPRVASLWSRAKLLVWPERYVLASLPSSALPESARLLSSSAGKFAALVAERDEVSLTVEQGVWSNSELRRQARGAAGPLRSITLDLQLDLDVCGFLAPAAVRLAAAGISIVPQCGYLKDHLLVHESNLERTVEVLEAFILGCRRQTFQE